MTMKLTGPIQGTYRYYQRRGYYGDVARQREVPIFDSLKSVDSDTLYPGDGVLYDIGQNGFRKPNNDAERRAVVGIVSYDQNRKPENATGTNQKIGYDTNEILKVGIRGTFWAKAGEDLEYGMVVEFDEDNTEWVAGARHLGGVTVVLGGNTEFLGSSPTLTTSGQVTGVSGSLTDDTTYYFSVNGVPITWHNNNGGTINNNTAANLQNAFHLAGFNDVSVTQSSSQFVITKLGGVHYINPAVVVDLDVDEDDTVAIAFGR